MNTEETSHRAFAEAGQTNLSAYDNSWFNPGPRWKVVLWHFTNACFFNGYWPLPSGLKISLLRWFGATVGTGVLIKPAVNIKYPWLLSIGNHVWIGENVWIDNLTYVTIGDHVCLSQGAMLLTGNHNYTRPTFDLMVAGITLEAGAWIGARATVCPGVVVHSHAILSAGSVATRSLNSYTIYQGNPAVAVRERVIQA